MGVAESVHVEATASKEVGSRAEESGQLVDIPDAELELDVVVQAARRGVSADAARVASEVEAQAVMQAHAAASAVVVSHAHLIACQDVASAAHEENKEMSRVTSGLSKQVSEMTRTKEQAT